MSRAEKARDISAASAQGPDLAAILAGCAHGDAGAMEALRHWQNGRLGEMLTRTLVEPRLAQAAFERMLTELKNEAGTFPGGGEAAAEDWLFARIRLEARKAGRDGLATPKLYAVTTGLRSIEADPGRHTPMQSAPSPVPRDIDHTGVETDDAAPVIVNARMRRPSAPAKAGGFATVHEPAYDRREGWGWLPILLLWLGAGVVGFGLALMALRYLAPPPTVEIASPAEVTPPGPPMPSTSEAERPATQAYELLGPPIAAREPPMLALPVEPAAAPAPPVEPANTGRRLVLHHGSDADSNQVADQLASQLQAAGFGPVEIRSVTFDVATASIRYFHSGDRAGAARLVAAIGPFLAWHGRAAPSTPIDFTDFRPLPRLGTLEIWLPRR